MIFSPQPSPTSARIARGVGIIAMIGGIIVAVTTDLVGGVMITSFGILFAAMSSVLMPNEHTVRWQRLILVVGTIAGIIGWVMAVIKVL